MTPQQKHALMLIQVIIGLIAIFFCIIAIPSAYMTTVGILAVLNASQLPTIILGVWMYSASNGADLALIFGATCLLSIGMIVFCARRFRKIRERIVSSSS